eukprot:486778_1
MAAKKTTGLIIGGLAIGAIAAVTAAATVHDLKQEKKAKREMHKHKDLIEQKKQYIEHGNIQKYNPLTEINISLLGFHNKYISGYKNGKLELKKSNIGENEIFTSIPILKDIETQKDYRMKVCFKLNNTNLYLSCEKNGSLSLKKWCRNWETFCVEKEEKSGMFSFKSYHNTYLCAEKNKAVGNRKRKGDWEKWRCIVVQKNDTAKDEKHVTKGKDENYSNPPQPMVENDGSYY